MIDILGYESDVREQSLEALYLVSIPHGVVLIDTIVRTSSSVVTLQDRP